MLLKQKRGKRERIWDGNRDWEGERIEGLPCGIDLHFSGGSFDFGSFCSRANDISPFPCSRKK